MFTLPSIFKRYRIKILGTFGLLLIENLLTVAQPLVFGIAINDLLQGTYNGVFLVAGLYAASFLIGTGRRMYDTRVYTRVYADLAPELIKDQKEKEVANSAVITRSGLVKELVDFFENDMTMGFTSIMTVIGAAVMLFVLDWRLFLGCAAAGVLIYVIYLLSEKQIYSVNTSFNDELEEQVELITVGEPNAISQHFRKLAKWQVNLSDREAVNFGLIEMIIFALAIFSLFVAVSSPNPTAGGIFSILSYILAFGEGVYLLPWIFQQLIRLQEITNRLSLQAKEASNV